MRIAICDYSGHPFQVELSRALAARGHDALHLHFAEFRTPKGSLAPCPGDPPTFHGEGISVGEPFAKENFAKRRFQEIRVGELMAARVLAFDPDVAVGCNMPLDAQNRLHRACTRNDVAFVFWLQDIYSRAISHFLAKKLGPLGGAIGHYYTALERRLLRSSAAVVAISDSFRPALRAWGVNEAAITVIPNWAPLSEIEPMPKDNPWARAHGLHAKPVALYSGTLGLKHDPAFLVSLARAARGSGLQVVVVSEGPAIDWLRDQKSAENLSNLVLLPFQPMSEYPEVLGAADVVLAMIGEEAAAFSVPSKVLSYLAAGKPIVASIAENNDAARIITMASCGYIVRPGDAKQFTERVMAVAADAELRAEMSRNARHYALTHFDIERIADRFEAVFLGHTGLGALSA